ncbi:MAG TPA: hypothetical protein VES73_10960 [Lamprocystis sp. (in: g-proteobacteria)]|nr:hypothetical protein [Lamprocystis sp. (in: g-proteobacteria)]
MQDEMEDSLILLREGDLVNAEVCLNTILERVPYHPTALGNLAGIRAHPGAGRRVPRGPAPGDCGPPGVSV